jgi:hypothetical protein
MFQEFVQRVVLVREDKNRRGTSAFQQSLDQFHADESLSSA